MLLKKQKILKISNLLVSQPKPVGARSPYLDLAEKLHLNVDFRQFIKVEGITMKEFRSQHINFADFTAVIFTSKIGIDNYFTIAKETKFAVPETMKYFCSTEGIALYLQKYIVYRKRKIFHGNNNIKDLADALKKNISEKFLLAHSDVSSNEIPDFLDKMKIDYKKVLLYKTVSADLSDMKENLSKFDMLVFFTPAGIKSLSENFPDFVQNETKIAAFGATTCDAVEKAGYRLDVKAPTKEDPSMTSAIEHFIVAHNKKK